MAHLVLTSAFSWWRLSREIVVACALVSPSLDVSSVDPPFFFASIRPLSPSSPAFLSSPLLEGEEKRLLVC